MKSIGIPLAFHWLSIDIPLYYWDMSPIIGIWLHLNWLLIGCQLIGSRLASDWILIECQLVSNWHPIGDKLAVDMELNLRLDVNWHLIDTQLKYRIVSQSYLNWNQIWSQLESDWMSIGIQLAVNFHPIRSRFASDWMSDLIAIGIWLSVKLHLIGC